MVATSVPSQSRAEDALIPLVADVRDDLRRRRRSWTVTKPPDWGTAICARDARGQEAALNWFTGEATRASGQSPPPSNEEGVPGGPERADHNLG